MQKSHNFLTKEDLPFYCPPKGSDGEHPRVFLDINEDNQSAICPYCSMKYVLKMDEK